MMILIAPTVKIPKDIFTLPLPLLVTDFIGQGFYWIKSNLVLDDIYHEYDCIRSTVLPPLRWAQEQQPGRPGRDSPSSCRPPRNSSSSPTARCREFIKHFPLGLLCQGPKKGDRIVYVAGAFDLFHIGHLAFLEKCREHGDYLIVGLHTDPVVNRCPRRPLAPTPGTRGPTTPSWTCTRGPSPSWPTAASTKW